MTQRKAAQQCKHFGREDSKRSRQVTPKAVIGGPLDALAFAVPEPGAIALFFAGSLIALIAVRRKKTTE